MKFIIASMITLAALVSASDTKAQSKGYYVSRDEIKVTSPTNEVKRYYAGDGVILPPMGPWKCIVSVITYPTAELHHVKCSIDNGATSVILVAGCSTIKEGYELDSMLLSYDNGKVYSIMIGCTSRHE